jgi:tetratricopeptide (TPR) repeat protein
LTLKTVTTRDGTLLLYALLPTMRPYVEHHLEQAYDREVLRKRLMTAYLHLAELAYDELNRSAMVVAFVKQGREDFEWVCEALADETIAGAERSRYLFWWGWIVYRLGNSLHGLRFLERAKEVVEGTDSALTLHISNSMALVYSDTGQPQKALQLYEEALPISREVGNRAGEITNLVNLAGLLYSHFDQSANALLLLEQALQIFAVTGLTQDAAGQTVEQVQQWLAMMRDENISEPPSTLPFETIQQIVSNTIAVMTAASSHRPEWIERVTNTLQEAQQQGDDWQQERDFFTAVLAFLDGQSPTLPPDHPYAQAIESIRKCIASTGGETV